MPHQRPCSQFCQKVIFASIQCQINQIRLKLLNHPNSISLANSPIFYYPVPCIIILHFRQQQFKMQSESRLQEFAVQSKLGQGSFSCVYKVRRIDDGNYYAMKKVKIGQMRQKERENALNEVRILASISHPNIVNYRQAFFDDKTQTLCVVMQLADAGDIQKKVNDHLRLGTHFNQSQLWQALVQMARGLKVLHQINILHRDLKCANVFCTSDRFYKLGDLNVSKVAKRGMARTQTGTPYYTSPEVWNDRPYDAKCDIWSLGCVVYEMATLRPPFRANNLKELYAKIQKGMYQPLPRFYSQDLRSVISLCLKVLPTQRLSAAELLHHPLVLRNMSASQMAQNTNQQSNKCTLLKTIILPKNLKSLKQALPASQYEKPKGSGPQCKFRRANSANNIRSEIPQVIQSPKMGQNKSELFKYAFMRRPSQQAQKQMHSQRQEQPKALPRMERNNSVDYVRKRVDSNQSIENSRRSRENSREIQKQVIKQLPRPISRDKREIIRPPSHQINRIVRQVRQVRDSSRNSRGQVRYGSRERANSRDGSREGRENMQSINNRCRQIEARVKALMDKKRDEKEQRNPNLPYINPKDAKYKYQRPVSRERDLSKNKSIELAKQQSSSLKQNQPKKLLERPSSRQRLASLQRNNSRDRRPGALRYNF